MSFFSIAPTYSPEPAPINNASRSIMHIHHTMKGYRSPPKLRVVKVIFVVKLKDAEPTDLNDQLRQLRSVYVRKLLLL